MIDMSTELFRVNFVDADNMTATIAVFKSFEDIEANTDALYHCTVSLETRKIVSMFANSDELSECVIVHLMKCFNTAYIVQDCIYEQAIAYRDNVRLETNSKYSQAVFYHDFVASDLDIEFHQAYKYKN